MPKAAGTIEDYKKQLETAKRLAAKTTIKARSKKDDVRTRKPSGTGKKGGKSKKSEVEVEEDGGEEGDEADGKDMLDVP